MERQRQRNKRRRDGSSSRSTPLQQQLSKNGGKGQLLTRSLPNFKDVRRHAAGLGLQQRVVASRALLRGLTLVSSVVDGIAPVSVRELRRQRRRNSLTRWCAHRQQDRHQQSEDFVITESEVL